jgi:hypothetical protein
MLDRALLPTLSDTPRQHNRWLHYRYLILVDFYDCPLADLDWLKLHYDMAPRKNIPHRQYGRLGVVYKTCWNRLKSSDHRA